MQPIRLSFTPERADFAALLANERTPAALRIAFFAGVVAMSAGLGWLNDHSALVAALDGWSPPWGEVATLTVMVVAMFGVLIVLRNLSRAVRAALAAAAASPLTFAADDDGVAVAQQGRSAVHRWRDVRSVWVRNGRVFVALPGDRVIALPARVFAAASAMDAFVAAAEDRVRAESEREDARMAPPATPETAG